jgi:hypothetical protein
MKIWNASLVVCALLALLAPAARAAEAEVLLGISTDYDKQALTIQVASSGCTAKGDFEFALKDGVLTIRRKKKDACKAMEGALSLTYTLKEVGLEANKPFRLGNQLIANPMLAKVR